MAKQLSINVADGHSLDASDGKPTNALYVDEAGKVGIGTTTPSANLTVQANINFSKLLTGQVTVGKNSARVTRCRHFIYGRVKHRRVCSNSQ